MMGTQRLRIGIFVFPESFGAFASVQRPEIAAVVWLLIPSPAAAASGKFPLAGAASGR
jgi:hypothetical protein